MTIEDSVIAYGHKGSQLHKGAAMNNGRGESGERREVKQCDPSIVFTWPIQDNSLKSKDFGRPRSAPKGIESFVLTFKFYET